VVSAITVVAPTEHLKTQWAEAAHRVGIELNPNFRNAEGATSSAFMGVALTYAQVAAHPALHRQRTENRRTLVILDEIHHAGDALSWGDAVKEAFEPATKRLALTGTPFRSDINPIPFVTYAPDGEGVMRSAADYTYGYGDALRDAVVRPVLFLAYSGEMRWRTSAGDEIAATLGEPLTQEMMAHAWRTALDPKGDWIPSVLSAANKRLTEVRRGMRDAAGLVIATDHAAAKAYAKLLSQITGEATTVVLSDDPQASRKIETFTESDARWMVAVRMVSEGVDIPRLAVGVYATSTSTPLFFAQAVGRFVRARKRGETASVFLPSIPTLLQHAAQMEVERDHALDKPHRSETFAPEDALMARANSAQTTADTDQLSFEALGSEATFDRVLFDGGEFGMAAAVGSAEEEEYLGLPGLLDADQVALLLRKRQAEQAKQVKKGKPPSDVPVSLHRSIALLRKELSGLVGAWHHRTGQPHAHIHAELRRACGGPQTSQASIEQLQQRIDKLREWQSRR
jgi:superfamily II DNA or RNA helicase